MEFNSTNADKFISTTHYDGAAVERLNKCFEYAATQRWEDLQFRRMGHRLVVQHVNDRVNEVDTVEGDEARTMCERLKSRANINAADSRSAQDGRFALRFSHERGDSINRNLDVRVNYTPTDAGETMVCRLLAEVDEKLQLDNIVMPEAMRIAMQEFLAEKQGILIVVGPVGSGKTTFMYSIIHALHKLGKNIKTAEHPIEITFPGIDQIQVTRQLTFDDAIAAWLRQRTHVGLVGEVRTAETAMAVFRIGNTGTLVLTTIHADDAISVVDRCAKFGIDGETFAQSVKMIVYTRLINAFEPSDEHERVAPGNMARNWLERGGLYDERDRFVELPSSEFTKKIPLFEAIRITPEMRQAIVRGDDPKTLLELATRQPQFETVSEAAVRVAREGRTTLSAVLSLIGHSVEKVRATRLDKRLYASGALTASQQFDVVQQWGRARANGRIVTLWEMVLESGHSDLRQIIDAYGQDADAENRIGFFVERGLLDVEPMQRLVEAWKAAGMGTSLYRMLIDQAGLSPGEVYCKELLEYQRGGMYALD
jgi:general secretion pathway protein E